MTAGTTFLSAQNKQRHLSACADRCVGGAFGGQIDFIADPGSAFFDDRRNALEETADMFMAATEARKETVFGLFEDAGLVNDGPRTFDVTLGPEGAAPSGPQGAPGESMPMIGMAPAPEFGPRGV